MAGGGAEFSPEENLALVRLGFDYAWELPGDWEVAVSLVGDIKIDAYNALVFGFEVARAF